MATAEALRDRLPRLDLHFVGTVGGYERRLIAQYDIPLSAYSEVRAGPLHGLSWPRKCWSALLLGVGTLQALALMVRRRPRVLLLTGGWMGLPVALAAWLLRVPSVIYLPDIEPGLAIRALAPLAKRIAVNVAESAAFFPKRHSAVVGYPLRKAFTTADRAAGIARFGLSAGRLTLLVFGGSLGARSLNRALLPILPTLIDDGWQVLHITGVGNWEDTLAEIGDASYGNYQVFPYLEEIGLAMAATDLIVSRAGASVLAEYPYYAAPSILVPLARNWRYQQVNANYLADRGAAVVLPEEELVSRLLSTIRGLSSEGGKTLARMREQAAALAEQDGAERLATELLELAG